MSASLFSLLKNRVKVEAPKRASYLLLLLTFILALSSAKAQQPVQVIWPLTNDSESVYTSGIGSATFAYGPGLNSFRYDSINGATACGWNSRDLDKSDYFEYTITPERDESITLNKLDFDVSLNLVNMRIAVHYSLDNFQKQSIPIGHGIFVGKNSSRDLRVNTEITVRYPQSLSIRIYGWSAPTPTVNFFTGNVEFNGSLKGPSTIFSLSESHSDVNCYGAATGSIDLTVTGGTPPFIYNWTGPGSYTATTEDITGLSAGTYAVVVSDNDGDLGNLNVTIVEPPQLTLTANSNSPICEGNNLQLTSTPAGGVSPYTGFSWTGPSFTSTAQNPVINNALPSASGTYTVTVTDANGCTANASTITVVNPKPSVTALPASQTVCSNGNITNINITNPNAVTGTLFTWVRNNVAGLTGLENGTGAVISGAIASSTPGMLLTTTFTITATSPDGCSSTTTATVTVGDNTLPTITCQGNKTAGTNSACSYIHSGNAWDATSTDNCSTPVITWALSGATTGSGNTTLDGVTFNQGTTTVVWTATDAAGNVRSCSHTVIITDDDPPFITCVGNQTRNSNNAGCSYLVSGTELDPVTAGDNCSGYTVLNGFTNTSTLAGAVLPFGTTNIVWTITAANGQTAQCSYNVVVTDNTLPVFSNCPANITVYTGPGRITCDQTATWTVPTATDNCSSVSVTSNYNPGAFFPVGVTTVIYTATDGSGNSTICSFTVTVIDNTPPTFTAPNNITVWLTSSCTYNAGTGITGDVNTEYDNCSTGLQATYTDVIANGPCAGTFVITRTWSLTDIHNNTTTHNQIITVSDNLKPAITVPLSITIQCNSGTNTGTATATDNCGGPVTITFTDVNIPNPNCPSASTINRTWKATDCSGNFSTGLQVITVIDNTPPVITNIAHVTVACPSNIPDPNPSVITATDNCGTVSIVFFDEIPYGLDGMPGYCPTTVHRIYRVTDQCGNYTDATQIITVTSTCGCSPCATSDSYHLVDLTLAPTGVIVIPGVQREDKCCDAKKEECASFNVRIPDGAVGVQIDIDGATPSPQDWRIDCESVSIIGNVICIPGGDFHLFTYCKPGNNLNTFTFRTINGIVQSGDIIARVECNSQISVNTTVTNVTWNSISPGALGAYNSYLSCLNCPNPIFTPGPGAPPVIQYKVCGTIPNSPCTAPGGSMCDTITVYVHDAIEVTFNVDPGAFCNNNIPQIIATVTPPATTYTLTWHFGSNGTGPVAGTGYTFTPSATGLYSLVVVDTQGGIPCSTLIYNFFVAPDDQPPSVTAPADLILECGNPNNGQLIQNWLTTATAVDDHDLNPTISNNYTGITEGCNASVVVTFSATDRCINTGTATATIFINDTQVPTWNNNAGDLNRTVECSDVAALNAAQALAPTATDQCDLTVTVVKKAGVFVPDVACPQSGTYTNTFIATDDCLNNSSVYTQVIRVTDATLPVWTTIAGTLNVTLQCSDVAGLVAAQAMTPVAKDNCDGSVTITEASGSLVPGVCPTLGTYTNTFTATDDCGNQSVPFVQVITIRDLAAPVISTQAQNLTVECDGAGNTVQLNNWLNSNGGAVASDACTTISWTNNFTSLSDLCGNTGAATVTFTAKDACNNQVTTQATFTITDTQGPSITCPPNVTSTVDPGSCEADVINLGTPTVSDVCSGPVSISNNAPATFPAGVTTVTWTARDVCGNVTTCQQTVTVTDDIPPTITCPADVLAIAPPPECTLQVVTIDPPVLTDNCDISLLTLSWVKSGATTGSGSGDVNNTLFNVGITTVSYTVTDLWGNTDNCTFTVTVNDQVPPTIIDCHNAPINVNNDPGVCSATVTVVSPDVTDPCNEIVSVVNDFNNTSNASGQYPVGVTVVIWTITDRSGNHVHCSVTVTVTDTEAPVISCPPDQIEEITNGGCSITNVIVPDPTISDNCPYTLTWVMTGATTGVSPATGVNYVTGHTFNVGVTTVTYTVTDPSGNSDFCSFNVWIKNLDAPSLTVTCPADVTEVAEAGICGATVTVPAPVINNPCNEAYTITHNGTSGNNASGYYAVGTTIIHWIITDASGNVTPCDQTITVVDDQLPVINCPANQEQLITNGGCSLSNVIVPNPTFSDNCSVSTLTWVMTGATTGVSPATGINYVTGQTFNVGVTTVTYTVTDASGNTEDCSFTVWIKNLVAPQFLATCPIDVTVSAEAGLCEADVTVPAPVITNPCNEAYTITHDGISGSNASGSYPVGVTVIHWIIIDASGNTKVCNQTITVTDDELPVINCPANQVQEITNGGCSLSNVIVPDPTFSDNCSVTTLTWVMTGATTGVSDPTGINYVSGETFNVGVTTVTYTVTDANGNTEDCSFTVWIKNLDAPQFVATCPADVTAYATASACSADVIVPAPIITNPCNEAYTITNDSPIGIDPSGIYTVGVHHIHWVITDASGNITLCDQTITVIDDIHPLLSCPASFSANADFEQLYATNVPIPAPTYSDNCGWGSLTWILSGATTGASPATGMNELLVYTLNVGVNTVTYTATDINGNVTTCFFTITILAEPVIDCPVDITTTTDPGLCTATLNPGAPTLISGVEPITWTYTITNQAGTVIGSGNCTTATLPTCIGSFPFPSGINTISWTATNVSGVTNCTQTVTVTDDEAPTFTNPGPFSLCVQDIIVATYDGQPEPQADILPIRPDWHIIEAGNTDLDISNLSDNCCAIEDIQINWTITFSNGYPSISGTGQPSEYGSPIQLWGTTNYTEVTHIITYTISDCNGNTSLPVTSNILIKPRPNVIKQL